jgi:RNA polymerase sigma-70 factor, ECF subfamily
MLEDSSVARGCSLTADLLMMNDREQILVRLRERLFAFAASHYGRDAADDLVQETLVVLEQKYAQVVALEELVPLSMQILRFKFAGLRRKVGRRGENTTVSVDEIPIPDPHQSVVDEMEKREMLDRLKACLPQLGKRCQELFQLKLNGLQFAEIKVKMNAESINTVYTWDSRCRKELLTLMGGSWERNQ